ncbi:HNH endonuclease [Halobacterium sp. NMX12-1]|uniref:HNH endonuclease n=1 Tax=Halobacterium sp. NMX12-1 TaxID=3166650 RepID=A0AAU8CCS9_9EURY
MSTERPTSNSIAKAIPEDAAHTRERFWEKVDIADKDGCWEWQRATFPANGYGAFNIGGKAKYAHRIAYRMEIGSIPPSKQINHICDNPLCVNPSHLYCGTHQDNMRDAVKRGQHADSRPLETVREIRHRYNTEEITQRELADEYSISQSAVSKIVRGESYEFI